MDTIVIFVAAAALTAALVAATFVLARRAVRNANSIVDGLADEEATTGRCGVCRGLGTIIEPRGVRYYEPRQVTCWRCGGEGVPPAPQLP